MILNSLTLLRIGMFTFVYFNSQYWANDPEPSAAIDYKTGIMTLRMKAVLFFGSIDEWSPVLTYLQENGRDQQNKHQATFSLDPRREWSTWNMSLPKLESIFWHLSVVCAPARHPHSDKSKERDSSRQIICNLILLWYFLFQVMPAARLCGQSRQNILTKFAVSFVMISCNM